MRYSRILIISFALVFLLQGCANSQLSQDTDIQEVTDPQPSYAPDDLSHLLEDYLKAIENGVPSDMSLTLYNINPRFSSLIPYTKDDLIKTPETVIDATELSSRIDYLKKIDSSILLKPENSTVRDVLIYYYIETEADGIVLDVEMGRPGGAISVNGVEVKYNRVFFDLVEPYLDAWNMSIVPEPETWSPEGG